AELVARHLQPEGVVLALVPQRLRDVAAERVAQLAARLRAKEVRADVSLAPDKRLELALLRASGGHGPRLAPLLRELVGEPVRQPPAAAALDLAGEALDALHEARDLHAELLAFLA